VTSFARSRTDSFPCDRSEEATSEVKIPDANENTTPAANFQMFFESIPGLYLVLTADLHIVAASNLYLKATLKEREKIVGRHLFEVFPDNPEVPSSAVAKTRASMLRVLESRMPDVMPVQRHDVAEFEGGAFVEKYWSPINSPVLDEKGDVAFIIHRVEDITEFVQLNQRRSDELKETDELKLQFEVMESEIFLRAQDVQRANALLNSVNEELKKKEEQFRGLLEAAPDAMVIVNREGRIVFANAQTDGLFGYKRDELIGQTVELLIPERHRNQHVAQRIGYTADPKVRSMGTGLALTGVRKDGTEVPIEISLSPLNSEEGVLYLAAIRDVTDRRQVEADMRSAREAAEAEHQKLDLILKSLGEGVIVADKDGNFVLWNAEAEKLIAMSQRNVTPSQWAAEYGLFLPDQVTPYPTERLPLVRALRGESVDADEIFLWRPNLPQGIWLNVTARPLIDARGKLVGAALVLADITERNKIRAELLIRSTHDALTGIANRRHFTENLEKEWRRALRERSSIGLIMIDVDFFKQFNDTHGHLAGDECLRQIAQTISNQAGRPTDLVARYGGEEFAVLLSGGIEDAFTLGEKMRTAVEALAIPHRSSGISVIVTISVGVAAAVPSQQGQLQTLIKASDEALYQAKAKGRNRVEAAPSEQHTRPAGNYS